MTKFLKNINLFEDQIALVGIWVAGSVSFVWPTYLPQYRGVWIAPRENVNWVVAYVFGATGVVLGALALVYLQRWMKRNRPAGVLTAVPGIVVWVLIGSHVLYVGVPSLRIAVTLVLFGGCIVAWFTILFFEEFPSVPEILKLIHARYLEYLKQFLWLIAIVIVSYLAWEIQASTGGQRLAESSNTWVESFLQLLVTVGFGVGLVVLAFQRRLVAIETTLAGRKNP